MNCKTFTSPAGRQTCSQRDAIFSSLFIYIYIFIPFFFFSSVNCNIVAGYRVPINSYLCQYWRHWQSVVFRAANEDRRTGINTEKIATRTHPLQHKNMHKIRLGIVFILFRACCLYPQIYAFCFCFIRYATLKFFCSRQMRFADCVMDLEAEDRNK